MVIFFFVETARVELASRESTGKLSTCLVSCLDSQLPGRSGHKPVPETQPSCLKVCTGPMHPSSLSGDDVRDAGLSG